MSFIPDQVVSDIKQVWSEFKSDNSFWVSFQGFFHAINWQEPWILSLLAAHLITLAAVLLFRRRTALLAVIFFTSALVIYFGERLNSLAAEHWETFAEQNYFDETGIFWVVMVAAPLLLIMFTILVLYLLHVSGLLVRAKRQELKYKARERAAAQQGGSGSGAEVKKER